jgi:DNA-binding CsgD family transcriptional regulator
MDGDRTVASTANPAFAVSPGSGIVSWNEAAARLFGLEECEVLGRPCHEVLCGTDVFGNAYCGPRCPLVGMALRGEAVRHFELRFRDAARGSVRAGVSIVAVPDEGSGEFRLVHVLTPVSSPAETERRVDRSPAGTGPCLTPREVEVIRLLDEGVGTREIARLLCCSVATVRNHVQNILLKLEVHSRLEAVSVARRHRLL